MITFILFPKFISWREEVRFFNFVVLNLDNFLIFQMHFNKIRREKVFREIYNIWLQFISQILFSLDSMNFILLNISVMSLTESVCVSIITIQELLILVRKKQMTDKYKLVQILTNSD